MASNSFLVADLDDEVSTMQGVNVDAHQTYLNLIKYCDDGISKVMEGQTMTSDNGSSKAQGGVHARIATELPKEPKSVVDIVENIYKGFLNN